MDTPQNQPESGGSTSHNTPTAAIDNNDLLGGGIGTSQDHVTFTDADMMETGGSGDLGGGRVGGDLSQPQDQEAVEDEEFVTDAVDDGDDIAVQQP